MSSAPFLEAPAVTRDGRFLTINQTAVSGDLVMLFSWQDGR